MVSQKIRIKLKSFDHNLIDKSAEKIVKAVKTTGVVVSGPVRYQHVKESLQCCVHLTLTKKLGSSSNTAHTNA